MNQGGDVPILSSSAPEMSIDLSQTSFSRAMSCSDGDLCAMASIAESSSPILCDSVELPLCASESVCG